MGCSSSSSAPKKEQKAVTTGPAEQKAVTGVPVATSEPVTGQPVQPVQQKVPKKAGKFQIELEGKFQDYAAEEDMVLKRAWLVGHPNAKFSIRSQKYEYNFKKMVQKNVGSNKERKIRPPMGMTAPTQPLLPAGPMVVVTVTKESLGKTMEIKDPNNQGQMIEVSVPKGAKAGQKMAVPVPEKGEDAAAVQEKQRKHQGYSTGAKVAGGLAAVGVAGAVVGGVILGDHLSGGAVEGAAAEALGEDVGDAVGAATEWTATAAGDVAVYAEGAAGEVGAWAEDAGIADAAGEAVDWLGDAAEDTGEFIMSLF